MKPFCLEQVPSTWNRSEGQALHPPLAHSFGRGPGHSHLGDAHSGHPGGHSGRPGGRNGGRNGRPGSVLAGVRTADGHPGRHPGSTARGHHPGMATSLATIGRNSV